MLQLIKTEPVVDGETVVAALRAEEQLLVELCNALTAQRDGIARDDSAAIETATHGVSRAVMTLDEARRRREQLIQLLTEGERTPLEQLESMIGPVPGLSAARAAVRNAAKTAVRDLSLNQSILRGALRAGDAYLQALFASVGDQPSVYTAAPRPHDTAPSGVVVNRRA
jgi:flagellar FlgN protein